MIIKIDIREKDLISEINKIVLFVPLFKKLKVVSENLPLGDIILANDNGNEKGNGKEEVIIERKTVSDLLASIKDGRYEEQSYRLNGSSCHNHNIIYLIEGDVNKVNRFKESSHDILTSYSAMFSLNYFKGFSVFRSFNLNETAIIICNMAYKLEKGYASGKPAYYQNKHHKTNNETNNAADINIIANDDINKDINNDMNKDINNDMNKDVNMNKDDEIGSDSENQQLQSPKDYVSVIKKIKKENITPDNIGEIMLCQIPGISSVTAIAIMQKYNNILTLIKDLETDANCLKNISYTNSKGQIRKINKTCIVNIVKYLLKK
jgi:ERCC4-type nuclease